MKFKKLIFCSTSVLLGCSPFVQATEINWNGFMSIAAGKSLDDDTTYQVEPTTGGVYDDTFSFEPESVVGVQAQAVISDRLRGTVQMVAKGADEFNMGVDWAYLSYDLTDNLTLNAGRFRLPLYYFSDFLDVGYAYDWIRPPVEVYSTTTSQLEGINFYHTMFLGDVEVASQAWYGGIDDAQDIDFAGNSVESSFDSTNNMGVNTLLTWEWFKVRLLYNTTDLSSSMSGNIPGVGPFTSDSDMDITFMAAAFMVDYENFLWRSEITQSDITTVTAASAFAPATVSNEKSKAWYASVGYNIGDFTPHITHAETDPDTGSFFAKVKTNTVGVSWRFHPSAALKLEYLQSEQQSGSTPKTEVDVISTAIDIVF